MTLAPSQGPASIGSADRVRLIEQRMHALLGCRPAPRCRVRLVSRVSSFEWLFAYGGRTLTPVVVR